VGFLLALDHDGVDAAVGVLVGGAAEVGQALSAGGWWTVFSPLLMTLFLVQVSGVVLLEKTLAETKPGYKEYMATTSAFIPWFPKRLDSK